MPPRIIKSRCSGCSICIQECGNFCLEMDASRSLVRLIRGQRCVDCFICELKCPEAAIEVKLGRVQP